jgi:hypothetical protein
MLPANKRDRNLLPHHSKTEVMQEAKAAKE